MDSFYAGLPGISPVIKKSFESVTEMKEAFKKGRAYTEVFYGELCLIDTNNKNNPDNGKLYRRDYSGGTYLGQIVGPSGLSLGNLHISKIEEIDFEKPPFYFSLNDIYDTGKKITSSMALLKAIKDSENNTENTDENTKNSTENTDDEVEEQDNFYVIYAEFQELTSKGWKTVVNCYVGIYDVLNEVELHKDGHLEYKYSSNKTSLEKNSINWIKNFNFSEDGNFNVTFNNIDTLDKEIYRIIENTDENVTAENKKFLSNKFYAFDKDFTIEYNYNENENNSESIVVNFVKKEGKDKSSNYRFFKEGQEIENVENKKLSLNEDIFFYKKNEKQEPFLTIDSETGEVKYNLNRNSSASPSGLNNNRFLYTQTNNEIQVYYLYTYISPKDKDLIDNNIAIDSKSGTIILNTSEGSNQTSGDNVVTFSKLAIDNNFNIVLKTDENIGENTGDNTGGNTGGDTGDSTDENNYEGYRLSFTGDTFTISSNNSIIGGQYEYICTLKKDDITKKWSVVVKEDEEKSNALRIVDKINLYLDEKFYLIKDNEFFLDRNNALSFSKEEKNLIRHYYNQMIWMQDFWLQENGSFGYSLNNGWENWGQLDIKANVSLTVININDEQKTQWSKNSNEKNESISSGSWLCQEYEQNTIPSNNILDNYFYKNDTTKKIYTIALAPLENIFSSTEYLAIKDIKKDSKVDSAIESVTVFFSPKYKDTL